MRCRAHLYITQDAALYRKLIAANELNLIRRSEITPAQLADR